MHCPLCGSILEILPLEEPPEIDWDAEEAELDRQMAASKAVEEIRRRDCVCPTGCFKKDFPLYYHHPYDLKNAPGDSWSLSWIK